MFATGSSLHHIREANRLFALEITPGMRVLDAGAGTAPYRELFQHAHYETADFVQVNKRYAQQTYVCDLAAIPVEDGRFDRIVFNQVMEHLKEPGNVLSEFFRILKPGGKILCTCPFFFHEHEIPHDYFRYTQFGHRYLFEKAGFQIEKLEWLEGFYGTVAYQMQRIWKNLPVFDRQTVRSVTGLLCVPFLLLLKFAALPAAIMLAALDRRVKAVGRGYPLNYLVIARKP